MNWYYLNKSGGVVGPVSEKTLKELAAVGVLPPTAQVCREGTQEWISLADILESGAPGATEEFDTGGISAEDLTAHTGPGESSGHPDVGQGASQKPSFSDRLKSETSAGWSDIKRTSREASIHAQIEKVKHVDLRMALFSLGKKCYESGILESDLNEQFRAIRELDSAIASKMQTSEADADETKMAALKRMGRDTAKATHAQALTVKRQHLVTELGRAAYVKLTEEYRPLLEEEISAIEEIEGNIRSKEDEARVIGAGHAKGWKRITPKVAVAAALALLLLLGINLGLRITGGVDESLDDFPALIAQYLSKKGVPQDSTQAFNWYRAAAGQGDTEAQIAVALMYSQGEGVVEDRDLAGEWWAIAAQQGHPFAQYREGVRLEWASAGKGAAGIKAYMWLDLAASGDHFQVAEAAKKRRDELRDTMTEAEISEAKQMSRDWKPKSFDELLTTDDDRGNRKPSEEDFSPSQQSSFSYNSDLDEAIRSIAAVYPELTRDGHIRKLEDISGLRMNSSSNALKARAMVNELRGAAKISGQSEREFLDLSERKRIELLKDVTDIMSR